MENQEPIHSHYWPGGECIPITPQARRLGWEYDVYVTSQIWSRCITWTPDKKTNPDKRIFQILDSAWIGMGKALTTDPDRVMYTFKHWYWPLGRPKARKKVQITVGARLLLDPDTDKPWILLFHPLYDTPEVIRRGEPNKHREDDSLPDGSGDSV